MGMDLVLAMTVTTWSIELSPLFVILCRKEVTKKVVSALTAPPDLNYSNSY